jgi:hypothetical protein
MMSGSEFEVFFNRLYSEDPDLCDSLKTVYGESGWAGVMSSVNSLPFGVQARLKDLADTVRNEHLKKNRFVQETF